MLVYSADYRYLTGRRFRNGQLLGQATWLAFQRHAGSPAYRSAPGGAGGGAVTNLAAPIPCIDWFSGQTGEYITHTGDCSEGGGDVPTVYTGGGGPGGSGSGTGNYGGNGGGTGAVATLGKLSVTVGNLRPCAGKIVQDLQTMANNSQATGGPISKLIQAVSTNSNILISFAEQANLQNPSNGIPDRGITSHVVGTNKYTIILNSDFLPGNSGATDLSTGMVIIHEILHVYMFDWAERHNISPNANLDLIMNLYFNSNNTDRNLQHHETMTDMISYMGDGLLQYYNATLVSSLRTQTITQDYCQSLAWVGLMGTDAYKLKAANDPGWRDKVLAIIQVENHPDTAGATMGTSTGTMKLPTAKGSQPCK